MIDLLKQEIRPGDYIGRINVYNGSCDIHIHIVTGYTNKKVKALSPYGIRDVIDGVYYRYNENRVVNITPTRIVKLDSETVKTYYGGENFKKVEELRETILTEAK